MNPVLKYKNTIERRKAESRANKLRYQANLKSGFYESFFIRANHPAKPQAFWVRYTIFRDEKDARPALAELWAIWFDGETGRHVPVKAEYPLESARFATDHLHIDIGGSVLRSNRATGSVRNGENLINWDLSYEGAEPSLFLFPLFMYDTPVPRAKSLVNVPMASFRGSFTVNGQVHEIKNWIGSQNHNWGTRHTDEYAWGQVAGFDNAPESFLEIGTARLQLGPFRTPKLTATVLRHRGTEYEFNSTQTLLRNKAEYGYFFWKFEMENPRMRIKGEITANATDFTGLNYYNPPGGSKKCLNSKIASAIVRVEEKGKAGLQEVLETKSRAAFEILTDADDHGIKILTGDFHV